MAAGRKTGGRTKGTPNKSTNDVKALALQYAPAAFRELARLATEAENEAVRVSATKEILDRAYGKARQPLVGDEDESPIRVITKIEMVGVRPRDD